MLAGVLATMPSYDTAVFWAQLASIPVDRGRLRARRDRSQDAVRPPLWPPGRPGQPARAVHGDPEAPHLRHLEHRHAVRGARHRRDHVGAVLVRVHEPAWAAADLHEHSADLARAMTFHASAMFCFVFLLYFDLRRAALLIVATYAVLNALLTMALLGRRAAILRLRVDGRRGNRPSFLAFTVLLRELPWLHYHAFVTNNPSLLKEPLMAGHQLTGWPQGPRDRCRRFHRQPSHRGAGRRGRRRHRDGPLQFGLANRQSGLPRRRRARSDCRIASGNIEDSDFMMHVIEGPGDRVPPRGPDRHPLLLRGAAQLCADQYRRHAERARGGAALGTRARRAHLHLGGLWHGASGRRSTRTIRCRASRRTRPPRSAPTSSPRAIIVRSPRRSSPSGRLTRSARARARAPSSRRSSRRRSSATRSGSAR